MVVLASMLCVENVFYKPRLRKTQLPPGSQSSSNAHSGSSSNITLKNKGHHGYQNLYYGNINKEASDNRGDGPPSGRDLHRQMMTEEEERIELAHAALRHEYGDFLTLWNVFKQWERYGGYSYEWCERNFINYRAMKMARKIRLDFI